MRTLNPQGNFTINEAENITQEPKLLVPGLLQNASVHFSSLVAGARVQMNLTITFSARNGLPIGGRLRVDLGTGMVGQGIDYEVSSSVQTDDVSVSAEHGALFVSGVSAQAGSTLQLSFLGVRHEIYEGATKGFDITTLTQSGAQIDRYFLDSVTLLARDLSTPSVTLSDSRAFRSGVVCSVNFSLDSIGVLPNEGYVILIEFPFGVALGGVGETVQGVIAGASREYSVSIRGQVSLFMISRCNQSMNPLLLCAIEG